MSQKQTYSTIDMQKTGKRLKYMIESAGYTPKIIQSQLHLSCVQPIYRWYKGLILPSVDHLLTLSELLNVHMEDLLVKQNAMLIIYNVEQSNSQTAKKCLVEYYKRLYRSVV